MLSARMGALIIERVVGLRCLTEGMNRFANERGEVL